MMGTPHRPLLILLAVASAVASHDIDFDSHEAAKALVKVVIIVIGVVVFLTILAVVCCCCLPCCFLAKRRTRNRGEVHQPAQPVQGGQGPSYAQQPSGYQMQQPGGYQPQQPGGYQPQPGGYYPPPEQQQMVPPAYPVDHPPPYPGPPASYQDSFPSKQAPYNPNA